MGTTYRQFCPVAKAMELLDERWTLLVVRELVTGSRRFNDLRRGLPRISPTLLSKRLNQLAAAGLIERRPAEGEVQYLLTDAGQELRPIVEALGAWGTRWIGELGDTDLDPKLLLWDMHRNINRDTVPAGRAVVQFLFSGVPVGPREWWLVITEEDVDVCDRDPGFPVTVMVRSPLLRMTQIWRGDVSWAAAIRDGSLELIGPTTVRRALPKWFLLSPFAGVPRP
jgi:DNA-binding HxlR family transcriptional regulator